MARDYIMTRHRAVFEEVLTEIAGRPLAVVCTGGEEAVAPPPTAKEPGYPAPVTELLKIAGDGARVEEVTASAKRPVPMPIPTPTAEENEPYEVYEPTADEEAEMFDTDELPLDADT